jgi:phosphotransferase system enzyme I (PtsI)
MDPSRIAGRPQCSAAPRAIRDPGALARPAGGAGRDRADRARAAGRYDHRRRRYRHVVSPDRDNAAPLPATPRCREQLETQLARLRKLPAVTRDGTAIRLFANLELARETELALLNGAEGIGLLRSEFMFMNRPDLPDEDEQYETLKKIVTAMDGRTVTIRTLDVGADKLAPR